MAQSAEQQLYTYADLVEFPEDNLKREIIDGELFVSPSPVIRHQVASKGIYARMLDYERTGGGQAFFPRCDLFFGNTSVVEPDLMFVRADHLDRIGEKNIVAAPDLVVEVSSPSTRRWDQVRKRELYELYERFEVAEFWFVDLDAERAEAYVLRDGKYGPPQIKYAGETLEPKGLPGLVVPVAEALPAE